MKRKKQKANPESPKTKPSDKTPVSTKQEADPFDFGGIPKRDLKKNLGCG